jgi:hypothetical protein
MNEYYWFGNSIIRITGRNTKNIFYSYFFANKSKITAQMSLAAWKYAIDAGHIIKMESWEMAKFLLEKNYA